MVKNRSTDDDGAASSRPWYTTWKAYIVGAAGLIGALSAFHDETKKIILIIENFLPHDLAIKLPYSQIAFRDEEIRSILLSKKPSDKRIIDLFGAASSVTDRKYNDTRITSSVYNNELGALLITKIEDSVVSWVYSPADLPYGFKNDLADMQIAPKMNLGDLKTRFPQIQANVSDGNLLLNTSSIVFTIADSYSSSISTVMFLFSPRLECGTGMLGLGLSDTSVVRRFKDLSCKSPNSLGQIAVIMGGHALEFNDMIKLGIGFTNISDIMAQANITAFSMYDLIKRDALARFRRR